MEINFVAPDGKKLTMCPSLVLSVAECRKSVVRLKVKGDLVGRLALDCEQQPELIDWLVGWKERLATARGLNQDLWKERLLEWGFDVGDKDWRKVYEYFPTVYCRPFGWNEGSKEEYLANLEGSHYQVVTGNNARLMLPFAELVRLSPDSLTPKEWKLSNKGTIVGEVALFSLVRLSFNDRETAYCPKRSPEREFYYLYAEERTIYTGSFDSCYREAERLRRL